MAPLKTIAVALAVVSLCLTSACEEKKKESKKSDAPAPVAMVDPLIQNVFGKWGSNPSAFISAWGEEFILVFEPGRFTVNGVSQDASYVATNDPGGDRYVRVQLANGETLRLAQYTAGSTTVLSLRRSTEVRSYVIGRLQ